jgi:uncharacterized protein (TIRG00374 family)
LKTHGDRCRDHNAVNGEEVLITLLRAPVMRAFAFPGRLRWALALLLLASCALFVDLSDTIDIMARVPIYWIVFILGLWTVDRFLMAWKWSFLLRGLNIQIPLSTLTRLYYQGTFSGSFLPSSLAGDVLRAHWVSRRSGATHQVYASLIMEKVIGFVSAANWASIGVIVLAPYLLSEAAFNGLALALVGILLLNGLFLFSFHSSCSRLIQWILTRVPWAKVRVFFQRLCEAYSEFRDRHSALIWNGLLTVFEHGLQILIVFAMATSLGITADTTLFFAVTAVYLLIYRLPLSPDGWGIGEITAVGLFGLIGISAESGFALAFLSHVLQTIVVLPGLWFLWRSGFAM